MKVILTQDVAKIGRRFEVVDVSDGYALNKLIPQRMAEPATKANIKRVEARANKYAAEAADTATAFSAACEQLKDKKVAVTAEANEDGKLFQALKPEAIIEAVQSDAGVALNASWVHIPSPIKTTGEHTVLLSHGEEQGDFTIDISNKS